MKKASIVIVAVLALWTRLSSAQCAQWDVVHGGQWRWQQNDDIIVTLSDVHQQGKVFTAIASYSSKVADPGNLSRNVSDTGKVDGSVDGAAFKAKVFWNNGDISVYKGEISAQGTIEGSIFIQQGKRVSKRLRFHSIERMDCATAGSTPAAPKTLPNAGVQPSKCTRWDVSGKWSFHQGAEKLHVVVDLQQNGSAITGTGYYTTYDDGSNGVLGIGGKAPSSEERRGTITGTINGSILELRMSWSNGSSGKYQGEIGDDGIPSGNMSASGIRGNFHWRGDKSMKCLGTTTH